MEASSLVGEPSQHGLGHLLNPTDPEGESRDWIGQLWEYIICKHLGQNPEAPPWLDRPALSRVSASTPELVKRLNAARKRLPYDQQVKPFNFALAAHVRSWDLPNDAEPERFQLIAPFERDARKWTKLAWVDRHTGKQYAITTKPSTQPEAVRVKSYLDVLAEYETHPESKNAGPDGAPSRQARGLLTRLHVRIMPDKVSYIGKESNKYESVESDLVHDLEEVLEVYQPPADRKNAGQRPWVLRQER